MRVSDGYPSETDTQSWNSKLDDLLHSELEANPEAELLPKFDAALKENLQAQLSSNLGEERQKDQIKDERELWQDIFDREQNFYDGSEWLSQTLESFREDVEGLYMMLEVDAERTDEAGWHHRYFMIP